MGEWAIERAWSMGFNAAYVAPLRAIVEERIAEWQHLYPKRTVTAHTGTSGRGARPQHTDYLLPVTPEKLATYLSSWKNNLGWISRLGVLVIDEVHVLGDYSRGAILESLLGRVERVNPFIRIVALSATLSNASEVASWMKARLFESSWRPVPITHRLRRYKRPADKPEHLAEEIEQTRSDGGRTLVFVNSRRRAETLAAHLRAHGFNVSFTHAGLNAAAQAEAHAQMRSGALDALVATSTLEMGVNLPARKVVVYDNYAFDGDTFQPLRVQRYLQFAGRAGRPGLDPTGEAVLFAPVWDSLADRCLKATPEPVRSGLFTSNQLAREVLYEVSSRLSVSERHLEVNFAQRTLWRHQGGQRNLVTTVRSLVEGGLLKETDKEERTYLSHTALGKIATQMSLSPGTIILLAKAYAELHRPTDFDLLLIACLADEVTPKLGFNFEEIDNLGDLVQEAPSHLLGRTVSQVSRLRSHCTEQSLLSAVKCATILHSHTGLEDLATLAKRFDCYPADLHSLKRNVVWVLEAAQRVFSVLNRREFNREHENEEDPGKPPMSVHEVVAEGLKLMVEYGMPKGAISLVRIDGIGAKRAQRLCTEGIFTAQLLAQYSAEHLGELLALGANTAERMLASAKLHASTVDPVLQAVPNSPALGAASASRPFNLRGVDPYRLRRSLELKVDHLSAEAVRISGGTEPHTVSVTESPARQRSYTCDCADFAKGHALCKHVLRAKMAMHDDEDLRPIVAGFKRSSDDVALRYALGDLWMKAGKAYDTYFARQTVAATANLAPPERPRRAR